MQRHSEENRLELFFLLFSLRKCETIFRLEGEIGRRKKFQENGTTSGGKKGEITSHSLPLPTPSNTLNISDHHRRLDVRNQLENEIQLNSCQLLALIE